MDIFKKFARRQPFPKKTYREFSLNDIDLPEISKYGIFSESFFKTIQTFSTQKIGLNLIKNQHLPSLLQPQDC